MYRASKETWLNAVKSASWQSYSWCGKFKSDKKEPWFGYRLESIIHIQQDENHQCQEYYNQ